MTTTSRAMVLEKPGEPLVLRETPVPVPGPHQLLLSVQACGVCRTDLHLVDGELPDPKLPVVPGHEVVGKVLALGRAVTGFSEGERVGVPWLGWTCSHCFYCRRGQENLCDGARFTGYTLDGGYSDHILADARYCFRLPAQFGDAEAAPLLCAGLIGYRSLRMAGDAERLGIYGFGAAAHIIAQVALYQGRKLFAFTRPGDSGAQAFARQLGCAWAGDSTEESPDELDAAIIFAPVGALVPRALKAIRPGGKVVCAGIHMSDIPGFPYRDLWRERQILSVANLTRDDAIEFLQVAAQAEVKTEVETHSLEDANSALDRLREGRFNGAAVLLPGMERAKGEKSTVRSWNEECRPST